MTENKVCPKCNESKPISSYHKNKRAHDGVQSHCIPCRQQYDRSPAKIARDKARYHSNKAGYLDSYYTREYGITLRDYDDVLKAQGGVCAICKKVCSTGRRLAVDHCHSTGYVRGLLCTHCNQAIGKFNDDVSLLQQAIEYLSNGRKYGTSDK